MRVWPPGLLPLGFHARSFCKPPGCELQWGTTSKVAGGHKSPLEGCPHSHSYASLQVSLKIRKHVVCGPICFEWVVQTCICFARMGSLNRLDPFLPATFWVPDLFLRRTNTTMEPNEPAFHTTFVTTRGTPVLHLSELPGSSAKGHQGEAVGFGLEQTLGSGVVCLFVLVC